MNKEVSLVPEHGVQLIKAVEKQVGEEREPSIPEMRLDPEVSPSLTPDQETALHDQWDTFWKLRRKIVGQHERQNVQVDPHTLFHHASLRDTKGALRTEMLRSILDSGLISGEISFNDKPFIPEDNETHYCADFFTASKASSVSEYVQVANSIEPGSRLRKKPPESYNCPRVDNSSIAFVIDGNDPNLQPLLKLSATGENKTELADFPLRFPLTGDAVKRHKAVLVGIPANFISAIILGGKIVEDKSALKLLDLMIKDAGLRIQLVDSNGSILLTEDEKFENKSE